MAKRSRKSLHKLLVETAGTKNVYFQPPANIQMQYPCVVYDLVSTDADYADNIRYISKRRWSLLVIDKNPDSEIPEKLLELPYASENPNNRKYKASGLYHFSLTLYY